MEFYGKFKIRSKNFSQNTCVTRGMCLTVINYVVQM